jgi:ribokinase
MAIELTVVGSINVDLVAAVGRLPRPGETLLAERLERHRGGKGANQAVAAALLGARVRMVGAVGRDAFADFALEGLIAAGVELELEQHDGPTGLALIYRAADGETQIVVVPGANALLGPREVEGAVLCQLEVTDAVVTAAAARASFFALNAAPVRPLPLEPDLLVVNRLEYEVAQGGRLVAVTDGAAGAVLYEGGVEVARATAPQVRAVDGTGAGDAFTACLVVSLLEGRPRQAALERACAAGAYAATRPGAQGSFPDREALEACA